VSDPGPLLDPDKGAHILAVGRKGSGKSVLARTLFDSYPYDSLVLDVTGDLWRDFINEGMQHDPAVKLERLTSPLPARLPPPREDGRRQVFAFCPDMGDDHALDEMDRAIGLALRRGRMLIWFDEVGVIAPAGRTQPNMRRYLHHGRHHQITGLACGPRPIDVDPLVVAQIDHAFVFALANPADRRRIADNIGWPPKDVDAAVHGLGPHEFLHWHGATGDLTHYPALPLRAQRDQAPA
jgi:hypothetical protein